MPTGLIATVTPQVTVVDGDALTATLLNQIANPSVTVTGTVGGTSSVSVDGVTITDAGSGLQVVDGGIATLQLADAAVTEDKIQPGGVTTDKILDANVTAGKLAADSVITAKILDLNVTEGKIANLAVTAGKIAADAVTTAKILDANVTAGKLAATLDLSSKTVTLPAATTWTPGFTSTWTAISAATIIDTAHSLGATPNLVRGVLKCTSTDAGYAVNDEINASSVSYGDRIAFVIGANVSNVFATCAGTSGLDICSKSGNDVVTFTPAKWQIKVIAWK